jgi:hypothetical protein
MGAFSVERVFLTQPANVLQTGARSTMEGSQSAEPIWLVGFSALCSFLNFGGRENHSLREAVQCVCVTLVSELVFSVGNREQYCYPWLVISAPCRSEPYRAGARGFRGFRVFTYFPLLPSFGR